MPALEPEVRTAKIRQLNDLLRNRKASGRVVFAGELSNIVSEDAEALEGLMQAVGAFNNFDDGNDPYNEHDFGAIEFRGQKVFFKIDYYNHSLDGASPDPADPNVTKRVMTIFYARDY